MIRFLITAVFLLSGIAVMAIGMYGTFKFRYSANRMHASAVNDTLGIALCMLGLAVSAPDLAAALKLLLVLVFFFISAPASSHLLCRLEVETNEDRDRYMHVHNRTLQAERAAQEEAMNADAGQTAEEAGAQSDAEQIKEEDSLEMPPEQTETEESRDGLAPEEAGEEEEA